MSLRCMFCANRLGSGHLVPSVRRSMRKALLIALAVATAGCTSLPPESPRDIVQVPAVGKFSKAKPGDVLPSGWQVWKLSSFKKATQYQLVIDDGRAVMKATARGSASGIAYPLNVDLKRHPLLRWRWKVPALIKKADNTKRHTEDAPVRLVVTFSGDHNKLPLDERIFAQQFQMFTGAKLPYSTLMYIWENHAAKDTIIPNLHTSRIRMIVAESGAARLGQWREETRNVYEDYRRAFGEEPPPVKSIAIMTDTDNTGEQVDAYYGDIAFVAAPLEE